MCEIDNRSSFTCPDAEDEADDAAAAALEVLPAHRRGDNV